MKRRLLFLLISILTIFSVLLVLKTRNKQEESGQVLRLHLRNFPTLDPRRITFAHSSSLIVMPMIYRGLTRMESDGFSSLCLASSFRVEQEGQLYMFKIKRELWSDGTPITSRDFAESWRSALDPSFSSLTSSLLFCIRNAEQIKLGKADPQTLGVYTPNDEELLIELEHFIPVETFLEMLSKPPFFAIGSYQDGFRPLYNGAYVPIQSKRKSYLFELKRNPFSSEKAFFHSVRFMISENKEYPLFLFHQSKLDWIGAPIFFLSNQLFFSELKENIESVKSYLPVGTIWLICNTKSSNFSSQQMRWMLCHTIDREELCHRLGKDFIPAYKLLPQMPNDPLPNFSYKISSEKKIFEDKIVNFLVKDRTCEQLVASYIVEQLEQKTNMQFSLQKVRELSFFSNWIDSKQFDLAVFKWLWISRDPYEFFSVFLSQKCEFSQLNSRKLLLQLEEKQKIRGKSKSFWSDLEKDILRQFPVIPLVQEPFRALKRKELENVILLPGGQVDFSRSYWKKQ